TIPFPGTIPVCCAFVYGMREKALGERGCEEEERREKARGICCVHVVESIPLVRIPREKVHFFRTKPSYRSSLLELKSTFCGTISNPVPVVAISNKKKEQKSGQTPLIRILSAK
ncbi:hypothetical protein NEAUS07_2685, partial [Nematocida ausubeli]